MSGGVLNHPDYYPAIMPCTIDSSGIRQRLYYKTTELIVSKKSINLEPFTKIRLVCSVAQAITSEFYFFVTAGVHTKNNVNGGNGGVASSAVVEIGDVRTVVLDVSSLSGHYHLSFRLNSGSRSSEREGYALISRIEFLTT